MLDENGDTLLTDRKRALGFTKASSEHPLNIPVRKDGTVGTALQY